MKKGNLQKKLLSYGRLKPKLFLVKMDLPFFRTNISVMFYEVKNSISEIYFVLDKLKRQFSLLHCPLVKMLYCCNEL